jgi:hypothetical protein
MLAFAIGMSKTVSTYDVLSRDEYSRIVLAIVADDDAKKPTRQLLDCVAPVSGIIAALLLEYSYAVSHPPPNA